MIEEDEENDNNLIKINGDMSYSISVLNDDASTYTGVKSVNEEQSTISNNTINKRTKNNHNKYYKNKKNKKEKSISSITESNNSYSSKDEKESLIDNVNENIEKEEKKDDKKDEKKEEKSEEIKTLFEWDGDGELVYLTGSFCDWKKFYKMTKNENGIFSVTLSLPRGFHQYKFKVDENWVYSKNLPKFEDNGNVNNFIDTTDYSTENNLENETDENNIKINKEEKNKEKPKIKIKNKSKSKGKKRKKPKKRYSSIHTVNFLNSQNNYTLYYPLKSELNIKPSSLPCLYKAHFILNEDFKPKKERKFTKIEYINDSSSESSSSSSFSDTSSVEESSHSKITIFGEVVPYVKFQNLYHIHSNHLHSKIFTYKDSTVTSMTSRYRIKFSTFIYYKPNIKMETKRRTKHSKTVKIKKK